MTLKCIQNEKLSFKQSVSFERTLERNLSQFFHISFYSWPRCKWTTYDVCSVYTEFVNFILENSSKIPLGCVNWVTGSWKRISQQTSSPLEEPTVSQHCDGSTTNEVINPALNVTEKKKKDCGSDVHQYNTRRKKNFILRTFILRI